MISIIIIRFCESRSAECCAPASNFALNHKLIISLKLSRLALNVPWMFLVNYESFTLNHKLVISLQLSIVPNNECVYIKVAETAMSEDGSSFHKYSRLKHLRLHHKTPEFTAHRQNSQWDKTVSETKQSVKQNSQSECMTKLVKCARPINNSSIIGWLISH
jgi:hypothetical protein